MSHVGGFLEGRNNADAVDNMSFVQEAQALLTLLESGNRN